MKKRNQRFPLVAAVVAVAAVGCTAWWLGSRGSSETTERKVLYYQDSMHPWIKSDQPGKCTICVMDLTPIYEGDQGFGGSDDMVMLSDNSVTVMNVQTEEVARRPLELTMQVAGTLEANETRKTVLAAPAAGRIEVLNVDYAGVEVEEGQVLVTFYSPELALEKRRYLVRSRVATQKDPYAATPTSALDLAKVSVGSDPYFQDLISPQSGTVLERNVYSGQYVAEGDTLFTIADSSVLWFRFDVYENQLPWFTHGQTLEVTVPAVPGRVFPAEVSFIEPTLDPVTRTVKVRADIPNPEMEMAGGHKMRLLRYGMYADGLVTVQMPDIVAVSRSAILLPGSEAYAYVERGSGAYERRRVKIGRQGDTLCEVLQGLEEGDRVVTAGNVLIDAQAQFMRRHDPIAESSADPAMAGMEGSTTESLPPALNEAQHQAVNGFLAVASDISSALAADNLKSLRAPTEKLASVSAALARAFPLDHPWHGKIRAVKATSVWPVSKDLAAARETFLPFSTNVVALVQQLQREEAYATNKVYFCPMAPKPGLWFQAKGPLLNPYYGAKMLHCGEEVPPRPVIHRPVTMMMTSTGHDHGMAVPTQAPAMEPAMGMESKMAVPSEAPEMNHTMAMGANAPRPDPESASGHASHIMAPAAPAASRMPSMPDADSNDSADAGMSHSSGMSGMADAASSSPAVVMPERVQAPMLPQAAGPGIRSGRRSVGMAFWQRASELYASTRTNTVATNAPTATEPLDEEHQVVRIFFATAGGISEALAADDLEAFNRHFGTLGEVLPFLGEVYARPHPWSTVVHKLSLVGHGGPAVDLEEARRRFLPFSVNAVEFGRRLRKEEPKWVNLKIYQCPMAPKPGVWLQSKGPLRNPYFGATMLHCGEEVAQ